jgi:hypothetical protein
MEGAIERSINIEIPPYHAPGNWMIGATTHAVDRIVPAVERIWLPEYAHGSGVVRFELFEASTAPPIRRASRKSRLLNKIRPTAEMRVGDQTFIDVRLDDFFNWSHQVNFYLTLALAARNWLGEPMLVLLPAGMPPIVFELYGLFGFETIATDGPVNGRQCSWTVPHWEVVHSGRKILVPNEFDLPNHQTPSKVFIARRRFRTIINQAEVEGMLPGYTKVYTEDLSAAEQFALFRNATHVVAVHGAGLAPMQFRSRSAPPLRLVEISPVGHATRWFGVMCDQVGGRYIQVRGRLKPKYVPYLYLDKPYYIHSSDSFEVDPASLTLALEMIEDGGNSWS